MNVVWSGKLLVDKGTFLCQIFGESKKQDEIVPAQSISEPITRLI